MRLWKTVRVISPTPQSLSRCQLCLMNCRGSLIDLSLPSCGCNLRNLAPRGGRLFTAFAVRHTQTRFGEGSCRTGWHALISSYTQTHCIEHCPTHSKYSKVQSAHADFLHKLDERPHARTSHQVLPAPLSSLPQFSPEIHCESKTQHVPKPFVFWEALAQTTESCIGPERDVTGLGWVL